MKGEEDEVQGRARVLWQSQVFAAYLEKKLPIFCFLLSVDLYWGGEFLERCSFYEI